MTAISGASILLITGPVQGGKTGFLSKLVDLLIKRGLKMGGFTCPGSFFAGKRSAFFIQNINTGKVFPMASIQERDSWIKYRRFWFNPDAFKQGREWIYSSIGKDPDVIVIDEVGPMELEGAGWSESLESIQNFPIPVQLWNVRESLIEEVAERWHVPADHMIHIEQFESSQVAERITGMVRTFRESIE